MIKCEIAIIGTGPAALMAGSILQSKGISVAFFDHNKAAGRKFLVAGKGGFNLTNNADIERFVDKYNHPIMQQAVRLFTKDHFIDFLKTLGIETYVGSSGKIFPVKGTKPIEVLDRWISQLKDNGANFYFSHRLIDFQNETLTFQCKDQLIQVASKKKIFALGGGSWKVTGSDGKWLTLFQSKGFATTEFKSSNSGFVLANYLNSEYLEGNFIKNCRVFNDCISKSGDVVFTSYGLEGAPIYALNGSFRQSNEIFIDFKPDLELVQIKSVLEKAKNPTDGLRHLKLNKQVLLFLKDCTSKEQFLEPEILAGLIKKLPLEIRSLRPIDEVISTVGGIDMREINESFAAIHFSNTYLIGEMLDWDAPTGGYLIQGCVASGYTAAQDIIAGLSLED
jgi:uncharacterized flavoprotein (TIGR03862 family)